MPEFILENTGNDQAQITAIFTDYELKAAFDETKYPIEGINYYFDNSFDSDELNVDNKQHLYNLLQGLDMLYILLDPSDKNKTIRVLKILAVAKDIGILTVIITTMPFPWEDNSHHEMAEINIGMIKCIADSLVIIPTDPSQDSQEIDQIWNLKNKLAIKAVRAPTEIITRRGLIRIDFADVRAVMSQMGLATMGVGKVSGKTRARLATDQALKSSSLDFVGLTKAKGVLVTITAGMNLGIGEFEEVGEIVNAIAPRSSTIVIGTVIDVDMIDELHVTIIATGIE